MSVTVNPNASKKDLKEVERYLENIDTKNVTHLHGDKGYTPWHGDSKSQSQTKITFHTKSMKTSEEPPRYITIVESKNGKGPFITFVSSQWDSAEDIVNAMMNELSGEELSRSNEMDEI